MWPLYRIANVKSSEDLRVQIFRPLPITGILVTTFCLSFAIMWRQREVPGSPAAKLPSIAPMVARPVAAPALPSASAAKPSAPAVAVTPVAEDLPVMPVKIEIRNMRHKKRVTAMVSNESDDPILVQVQIANADARQTAHLVLDLPPRGEKSFSTDDGLDIQSGDKVTLQNPQYRDRTEEVP
jgi:hypothetical protein